MKNIFRKLASTSGESLVESMASVLIFTLSSIILLSMIAVSVNINTQVKAMDKKLENELYIAEAQTPGMTKIGTTLETKTTNDQKMKVNYKETSETPVVTYDSGKGTLRSFSYKSAE